MNIFSVAGKLSSATVVKTPNSRKDLDYVKNWTIKLAQKKLSNLILSEIWHFIQNAKGLGPSVTINCVTKLLVFTLSVVIDSHIYSEIIWHVSCFVIQDCQAAWLQRKAALLWLQLWVPTPPIWGSWTWATIIQETQEWSYCLLHCRIQTGDWTLSGTVGGRFATWQNICVMNAVDKCSCCI